VGFHKAGFAGMQTGVARFDAVSPEYRGWTGSSGLGFYTFHHVITIYREAKSPKLDRGHIAIISSKQTKRTIKRPIPLLNPRDRQSSPIREISHPFVTQSDRECIHFYANHCSYRPFHSRLKPGGCCLDAGGGKFLRAARSNPSGTVLTCLDDSSYIAPADCGAVGGRPPGAGTALRPDGFVPVPHRCDH
jgi:hypothetical protein